MFVIIQGPVSARKLFLSFAVAALCAIYAMTQSNCESDFQLSLWTLILIAYLTTLAGLIALYPQAIDRVFGKARCPHCKKATWSLREILRISRWFHPRCPNCSAYVKLKLRGGLLLFLAFPIWFAALYFSNSIAISFITSMLFGLVCLKLLTSMQVLK